MNRREAAVISAYTGICVGPFSDIHAYAEQLLGRPIWTHEFAEKHVWEELKGLATADFMEIAKAVEELPYDPELMGIPQAMTHDELADAHYRVERGGI